ncbi:hypothetical protein [Bacillus safensis]|uniref:hypothetical protein n=1 Tax=Bacillus safensis TaxID=561879 RepID=UPI000462A535|nr:hypothetical protein [Bacillus safensis]
MTINATVNKHVPEAVRFINVEHNDLIVFGENKEKAWIIKNDGASIWSIIDTKSFSFVGGGDKLNIARVLKQCVPHDSYTVYKTNQYTIEIAVKWGVTE